MKTETIEDFCHKIETISDMEKSIRNSLLMKVIPWVIELDGQPIGVFNISPHKEDNNWETGYFIDIDYMRKGLEMEWCPL